MSRYTILCINDDENALSALERVFLDEDRYVIITANSAEKGLKILKEKAVDLIITNLYMPGIDGWKLCRILRSSQFSDYSKVPILVMSATFSGSDAEEITRELGADGFISIPYNPKDLLHTIENLLLGKIEQKKLQVLVVEDEQSMRNTIAEGFKEFGYSTFEATDSNQALLLYEKVNPDIVILDYHLPYRGGVKLLDVFKTAKHPAAVLVITGDTSPDLAIEVTQKGADAFVHKPFKIQYLITLCEKIRREWSLLRVEKILEDRTQELHRIIENSVDGIILTDAQGFITKINKALENLLGYSKNGLLRNTSPNLFRLVMGTKKRHMNLKRG